MRKRYILGSFCMLLSMMAGIHANASVVGEVGGKTMPLMLQQQTISGTITDENGNAFLGVKKTEKCTSNGTV